MTFNELHKSYYLPYCAENGVPAVNITQFYRIRLLFLKLSTDKVRNLIFPFILEILNAVITNGVKLSERAVTIMCAVGIVAD